MYRFANIDFLNILWLLPILLLAYILIRLHRRRRIKSLGDSAIVHQMMPDISGIRPHIKLVFILLTIGAMALVVSRPQFGLKSREVKRTGIEMIIALDVSNSMLAEDIQPNRLERAKLALSKMIDDLESDRVGLVVFAGKAYVQVPVTTDYSALKMMIASINTNMVPKQGTAMGDAIELALQMFNYENDLEKTIILITDGENHEDDPIAAAKNAAEKGISVHAIGLGSITGTPISFTGPYGQKIFHKDQDGNIVVSKLDEAILKETAFAGKGVYASGNSAGMGLKQILQEIDKMQKKSIDAKVYSDFEDQFQWFAWIALIFAILELILLERKPLWLQRLRLFEHSMEKRNGE